MCNWTSVNEPPNDNRDVLAWVKHEHSDDRYCQAYYNVHNKKWYLEDGYDQGWHVSHWMDITPP